MRFFAFASFALALIPGCYCSHLPDRFTFDDLDLNEAGVQDADVPDAAIDPSHDSGLPTCTMTCGGECTDTTRDPLHCGDCATSCSAPSNGVAVCMDGACTFRCDAGYYPMLGTCEPRLAPRPIAPLSSSTATSRRPTFRWELPSRSDGARIQICADRACTSVIQTIDAAGTSGRPTVDLPSGIIDLPSGIIFWRLYARDGDDVGVDSSPVWQLAIGVLTAPTDTSWGSALDLNGDGDADVVVGAPGIDSLTDIDIGRVYIYAGGSDWSSGASRTADMELSGTASGANYGSAIASAGDVDGDGFADLLVGAWATRSQAGGVFVYHGSSAGVEAEPRTTLVGPDTEGSNFGYSLSSAGDINGDGFADVIIGAPSFASSKGAVYLYLGSPSGLSASYALALHGMASGDRFGWSVAAAGDINGDGFGDVVIGAHSASGLAGAAYLYLGSASGLSHTPSVTLTGWTAPSFFGYSVSSAGDLNGDGLADIVIGAPGHDAIVGKVFIYYGRADGELADPTVLSGDLDGGDDFGSVVAALGDVDADGFAEIAVGAPRRAAGRGSVHVYLGSNTGVTPDQLAVRHGPDGSEGSFGRSISGGDVNGDGLSDMLVGAPAVLANSGRAYLLTGRASTAVDTVAHVLSCPELGECYYSESLSN